MGRISLMMVVSFIVLAAMAMSLGPLPEPKYVDTEVTTNVVFAVDFERNASLRLTLECAATATNSLEVSIGHDVDEDGRLSLEESDFAFGYDCGEWFHWKETGRGNGESELTDVGSSVQNGDLVVRRELMVKCRDIPHRWNLMRVTRRGRIAAGECVVLAFDRKRFTVIFR